jgi:tetratricopeptide (TPR) repeat protein
LTIPFLGRRHELDALLGWARESAAGTTRIVLLRGEAGIGKSFMLDELTTRLPPETLVLRGRCQQDVAIPYLAMSNALAPIVRDWEDAPGRFDNLERGDGHLRVYLRVTSSLQAVAATRPIAIVIDDLQWADDASVGLLSHLISTALVDESHGPAPYLFVLAHRPEVDSMPVQHALARYERETATRSITVAALPRAELRELITLTSGSPPSRKLLHDIEASSGGNPLMVSWLLRRLADFGALRTSRGVLVNASDGELVGLPADLDALLRERSSAVSPRCRSLLVAAALYGDDEPTSDLAAITAFGQPQFETLFNEAIDSGLLVEQGDRYRFSHPQVRQLHFHAPRGRRRRELHRQIADRLEAAHEGDPTYALPIAFHLRMAGDVGDTERLTRYGVAAANRAAAMGAWTEAWQLYEAVLDATADDAASPSAFRAVLEHRAALAAWWAHDNDAALEHAQRAVELARALGDLERWGLASVLTIRAVLPRTALGTPMRTEAVEEFIAAAGDGFDAVRARAHAALVEARVTEDRSDLAIDHALRAWDLALASGDEQLQREISFGVGSAHFGMLNITEASEWFERVQAKPDDDNPIVGVWLTSRSGLMRVLRGDIDGGEERLRRGAEWARRIGAHAEHALAACSLVTIDVARHDHARADGVAAEAELLTRLGDHPQAALLLYQALAASRAERGDRDGAHAAISAYRSYGVPGRHLHALVDALTGHLDEARGRLGAHVPVPVDRAGLWNINVVCADLVLGIRLRDERLVRCNYPAVADAFERGLAIGSGWPFDIAALLDEAKASGWAT